MHSGGNGEKMPDLCILLISNQAVAFFAYTQYFAKIIHGAEIASLPAGGINQYSRLKKAFNKNVFSKATNRNCPLVQTTLCQCPAGVSQIAFKNVLVKYTK